MRTTILIYKQWSKIANSLPMRKKNNAHFLSCNHWSLSFYMITDDSNTEWGILRTNAWQKKIPDQSLKTNCKASRSSGPSLYDSIGWFYLWMDKNYNVKQEELGGLLLRYFILSKRIFLNFQFDKKCFLGLLFIFYAKSLSEFWISKNNHWQAIFQQILTLPL